MSSEFNEDVLARRIEAALAARYDYPELAMKADEADVAARVSLVYFTEIAVTEPEIRRRVFEELIADLESRRGDKGFDQRLLLEWDYMIDVIRARMEADSE